MATPKAVDYNIQQLNSSVGPEKAQVFTLVMEEWMFESFVVKGEITLVANLVSLITAVQNMQYTHLNLNFMCLS